MDNSSTSSHKSVKFKIAYGSDIRRLKQELNNMDELKKTSQKMFKPNCDESQLKYYFYDSDEDRIEISDDDDFESTIKNSSKQTIKIHIEKYDPQKDPFFNSFLNSEKGDSNTGASTNSSHNKEDRLQQLASSTKSVEEETYPDFLNAFKGADSCSDNESDTNEEIQANNQIFKRNRLMSTGEELKDQSCLDNEESKMFGRKNTEVNTHGYEVLEHYQCRVSSRSIPKGYKLSNSNDPRFDSFWTKGLSKQVQDSLNSAEFLQLKKEWQFQVKAEKCFDKEYDRKRYAGLDRAYCKMKVMSGNQEERQKLAIVETEEALMGNTDIIFCKRGSLISKSWIVKNVGCTSWPKNTRLVVNEDVSDVVVPMILDVANPGDKMIITVNYTVPEYKEDDTDVHHLTFNLYKSKFGAFGQELQLTYHVDDELFDLKLKMDKEQKLLDRVKLSES